MSNFRFQQIILLFGIGIAIVKFIVYFYTRSNAIFSDALESLVNISANIVTLYGLYLAAKPKDLSHPYGHGKIEFLTASIEGSLLFSAGFYTIYKTIEDIIDGHIASISGLPLILVFLTGIANYALGYYSEKKGKETKSPSLVASGTHLKMDGYTSFGIVISLGFMYFKNLVWIDYLVAILISFILIYHGYKVLKSSILDILDTADETILKNIIDYLEINRAKTWIDLHNFRIIKYGSDYHIDAHLTLPWYINNSEIHSEMKKIHALINQHFGSQVELFIHPDPCEEFSCKYCQLSECKVRKQNFVHTIPWTLENVVLNEKHQLND